MSLAARLLTLPANARRTLALGILVLALLLAWFAIVQPVRGLLDSQRQWRQEVRRDIGRDRGLVAAADELRVAREAVTASALRAGLYDAKQGAPADQLQNDLRSALLAAGLEPTNFKPLPGVGADPLRVVRVEFASVMTVDQLRAFFAALDSQPHYVRIERLRLDAATEQRADDNPRLTALFEARGFTAEPGAAAPLRVARAD
ncbi:MAG TPA: type II secretion system protein GspM [Steroidobacteraceae bacterium]|nr:type II secretion system protein GspM [Steroidobacteraceae bacterium]